MTESFPASELQLPFLSHAMRHRWKLIVALAALAVAAAGGYVLTTNQSYSATAEVLINPIMGNAFSDQTSTNTSTLLVSMQTEAGVVGSVAVTQAVNAKLHLDLPTDPTQLTTTVPTNTQIIDVTYTARQAATAQAVAEAYAEGYLARRAELATSTRNLRLDSLNALSTRLQASLAAASKAAASRKPPPDAASQVQIYASQLTSVQSAIGQELALSTDPGSVITPAALPGRASAFGKLIIVLGALVAGLIIGLIIAVWRERRDDRIREDVAAESLGLPVLAKFDAAGRQRTATTLLPNGRDDQFRMARLGLRLGAPAPAVIALSPMTNLEPAAEVGLHLALALDAAGYRTVLIDAAVDEPEVAKIANLPNDRGLSDLLLGGEPLEPDFVAFHGIQVLSAGTDPSGAQDRYTGAVLRKFLDELRGEADYVIVVTSPLFSTMGLAVALAADAVALVATEHQTRRAQVLRVEEILARAGNRTLGVLLIKRHRRGVADPAPGQETDPHADAEPTAAAPAPDEDAASDSQDDPPEPSVPVRAQQGIRDRS